MTRRNEADTPDERSGIEKLTQLARDQLTSRRSFLAASAAAGTGAFAAPALAGDDHGDDSDEGANGDGADGMFFESDVDVLNYARTLEFLEARFYRQGLDNIGRERLTNHKVVQRHGDTIANEVFDELRTIQQHEETHAEVLGDVVADLGGEPVPEPEFDFGPAVNNTAHFLTVAAQLEDTGVAAYAGAAPSIQNAELVPPALSIHSVEARHASYLRTIGNATGFPDAFDDPLPPEEVLEIAGQFIVDTE